MRILVRLGKNCIKFLILKKICQLSVEKYIIATELHLA